MTPNKQLMRTCASCGVEKPLTAFLQISDTETTYGVICASCRSKEAKTKTTKKEEDYSGVSTGKRIGAKEKAFLDKEQFRQFKDLKSLYKQELKKKEDLLKEKDEKIISKEKDEKKHRLNYLDKKRQFLGKKPEIEIQPSDPLHPVMMDENVKKVDIFRQREMTDQEIRKVATHFSAFYHPIQEGRIEFHSEVFLRFIHFLGTSTQLPIITLLSQFNKKLLSQMDKKFQTTERKFLPEQEDKKGPELLADYAKNSWRPRRS